MKDRGLQAQLSRVASRLEELATELRAIGERLDGTAGTTERGTRASARSSRVTSGDLKSFIEKLQSSRRAEAKTKLEGFSHAELGDIFLAVGGQRQDTKKPKDWLINQILWQLFDFEYGHRMLRENR